MEERHLEQSKIVSTAMKIQHITNLNTYVLNRNRELVYHYEMIIIPAFMPGSRRRDVLFLYDTIEQRGQLYSYINEWDLHYFGYSFFERDEVYTIIIGPYFDKTPNLFLLSKEYRLSGTQREDLRLIAVKIDVLTVDEASSYGSVLQQFINMMEQELAPVVIFSKKSSGSVLNQEDHLNVDEEAEIVKLRYKTEKNFMHAVECGDKKTALALINSQNMLFSFSERFPNQPLQRLKNVAIILNTLLRMAARNSHVPAIMIHRISEKFAYDIVKANQVETLQQLEDRMIEEYCDLVISNSLSKYTYMTQQVIEYIHSFYNQPIIKEELAAKLSIHPSHLSRKFKEETKMTLTAYQQMLRINQAKHLLKTENLTVEEIAWTIGYEDPSYFARVFKKETGRSPSQYRDEAVE
ncbi:YesN/AraC family two-component response regulator [Neobacillus niacini]|uniref:helix-turn-helix transcriptional regulator n=1 Tax=Neobacillus niacini TaxID=86668 RepID=UPI00278B9202|nr:helix-turn-helix domain-containing protein [Neobacillus niacini]MDQ1004633.1 YesN/AraC family two-component response regulator [Neobacillus niacini]